MALRVDLTDQPASADVARVRQGLGDFNSPYVADDFRRLTLFLRDGDDGIVGGLLGSTEWRWLHVDILWIDAALRGQGYGSRLLAMAEEEAGRRGCWGAHLDTLSFQALPFYLARGYERFATLDDQPPGYQTYFLRKRWLTADG